MGRGVNYLSDALQITYFDVSEMGYEAPYNEETEDFDYEAEPEFDQCKNQEDWNDFKEGIQIALIKQFPSLNTVEKEWGNSETPIILRNSQIEFGISEYCGCASLSVRVVPEDDYESSSEFNRREALGKAFVDRHWDTILNLMDNTGYKQLNRIGGFSNGESVYGAR